MSKSILYIGNDLVQKSKYNSTMETLSGLLEGEGFLVVKASSKNNKLLRLIDMCLTVIVKSRDTDYVLIDTFSTVNFYYAFIISQLARMLRLKYIPILHGGNLPKRIEKSKWMSQLIFRHSYKNVAPSNYLKNAFEKEGYKTCFIPNVLELQNYHFKKRTIHRPKLLWVRAFRHLYNPTLAIEVLKELKVKFPNAVLCMIGPVKDDSFELTKKLVERYKLDGSVEFTGVLSKEDWCEKSKEFDVFINTTNFDNTPVSIMEAMALGLTIVSTNAGGMPFLVEHNVEGILVEKKNAEQMATAISKIVDENCSHLALRARQKAESFSWNIVKKQWLSILK